MELLIGALDAEIAPEDIGSGNPLVVGASLLVVLFTAVPLAQWLSSESDRRSPVRQLERWTAVIEGVTENSYARQTMQEAIDLKAFQIGLARLAPPLHRLRFLMWYFGIADVVLGSVVVIGVITQDPAFQPTSPAGAVFVYVTLAAFGLAAFAAGTARYVIRATWLRTETRERTGIRRSNRFRDLFLE